MQLKQLGPYDIGKPLGKGGMGSVYAATDTHTGQRVAVKALTPHLAMADGFRERFEAEIESLKTLRHEGIVRLFGYGEQDGVLFYSMELIDGVSLEEELKAGRRFNWREVTNIAVQLALALKHAHDHGVVHRDIKPANILLYGDDKVKLADFGIARLFGASQLTTAGGVLGTADYMSPEQADGRPVTARCDQYSLGGVMYALLAGRPPFRAKNLPQMLQLQRFAEPEPVRRFAPDTPEQLERIILQLLAKVPAERFPNTQVLARHLQAMARALSRPVVDDSALAEEHTIDEPVEIDLDQSSDTARTQDDSSGWPRSGVRGPPIDNHAGSAPATADSDSSRPSGTSVGDLAAQVATTLAEEETTSAAGQPAASRSAHFTTIEEEESRRQAERRRSWLVVAAQLAALAIVIGGMVYFGVYLTRPATDDELYQAITLQVEFNGEDALASVEPQIDDFLRRFPQDPRSAELRQYQRRIEVDRLERRLQLTARRGGAAVHSLLPVEQLYLRAVSESQDSPDAAIETLASLLALYGGSPESLADGDDSDRRERQALCVELAQRRLATLRTEWAEQIERQLAAIRERLDAAEHLSASDPQQAARMYRAIIDLHNEDAWAEAAVAEAHRNLKELDERLNE